MALYTETGYLAPAPPFDFARSLDFLGLFAPARGEQALEGGSLTKAVMVGGQPIGFRVESVAASIEEPRLAYTLFAARPFDTPGGPARGAVLDRIGFFLSLEDDLRPFYRLAAGDPPFAPVAERLYGYHQVKFPTPFENACWAVLTQRTPMAMARRVRRALVERFGGGITVDGAEHRAFPEPAAVVAASSGELAALVGQERRAEYLHAAATAFADVQETWLRQAPYEEVEGWLRGIKGIGAWSASFVLLRGLGRVERLPVGEARLVEAASEVYGRGEALTPVDVERLAVRYGPWQGYWAHYLRAAT